MSNINITVVELYNMCTISCSCPDNTCTAACGSDVNQALDSKFNQPAKNSAQQVQMAGRKL